jgi:hydroxyacylglutathione hydrolase
MRKVNVPQALKIIALSLPFGLGKVNCYLVETGSGYTLIDTGLAWQRPALEKQLVRAGCKPGNLALIVLTHGDVDHSGNGAYLREKYGAKIAIHPGESNVVERGDMTLSRNGTPFLARTALGFFKLSKSDRFEPDLYVEDGEDLSEYGFDALVLHTPGHSNGSIGILTKENETLATSAPGPGPHPGLRGAFSPGTRLRGSVRVREAPQPLGSALFCGDLLINSSKPILNSIMDDLAAANASVKKLSSLRIKTVYPGHGEPFPMDLFLKNYRSDKGE